MKVRRTTIVLEPDLDIVLKLESRRQQKSLKTLIEEALRDKYGGGKRGLPPGAGAYSSGHSDGAERFEEILGELGFGEDR